MNKSNKTTSRKPPEIDLETAAVSTMRRMAPRSVQDETPTVTGAVLCHIMLLNSVLERSANRFAEAHGLTFPQWMALGCIGHGGEKGITHSELGNRLMLSKAPITGVVDRLERGGFVRRVRDKQDRRVSCILITPLGDKTWRAVRDTMRERSLELCDCLSEDEQEQMLALLIRLLEATSSNDPTLAACRASASSEESSAPAVNGGPFPS